MIHVNTHTIKHNQKHQKKQPVIIVKKRCDPGEVSSPRERAPREGNTNQYGYEVAIPGGCRVVYRPDNPICGGARVWIESLYDVQIIY